MATPEKKKTSMGLEENVASGLCYIAGFITGLIFYFSEKENKTVRFHALQSIALNIVMIAVMIVVAILTTILNLISWQMIFVSGIISTIVWLALIAIWLVVMIRAFMGAKMKLPIIGDLCEKQANK